MQYVQSKLEFHQNLEFRTSINLSFLFLSSEGVQSDVRLPSAGSGRGELLRRRPDRQLHGHRRGLDDGAGAAHRTARHATRELRGTSANLNESPRVRFAFQEKVVANLDDNSTCWGPNSAPFDQEKTIDVSRHSRRSSSNCPQVCRSRLFDRLFPSTTTRHTSFPRVVPNSFLHIFRNHSVASRIPRWRRRWDQSVAKTGRTLAFSLVTNFTLFTQFYIFYSQHVPSLFFPHFLLVTPLWDIFVSRGHVAFTHTQKGLFPRPEMFFRSLNVVFSFSSKFRRRRANLRAFWIFICEHENELLQYSSWKTLGLDHQATHTHTRALFIVIRKETTMCLTYIRRPRRITSIIFPASFPEHSPIQRKRRRGKEKITKKIIKFYVSSKHT